MEIAERLQMAESDKQSLINQTVKNYGGKLMSYIRPKVNNREDAEDILQEVWYQFSNLSNIFEIVNVGSWLLEKTEKLTTQIRSKLTTRFGAN